MHLGKNLSKYFSDYAEQRNCLHHAVTLCISTQLLLFALLVVCFRLVPTFALGLLSITFTTIHSNCYAFIIFPQTNRSLDKDLMLFTFNNVSILHFTILLAPIPICFATIFHDKNIELGSQYQKFLKNKKHFPPVVGSQKWNVLICGYLLYLEQFLVWIIMN